jgi:TetR/AcrR family transcriptional repressor of lmrAB and yxaGH operons
VKTNVLYPYVYLVAGAVMPAPLIAKEEVLNRLASAFRTGGYKGTSLKDLCEATGLVKASLYHYFPGGKEEMAQAVLDHIGGWFAANVVAPMHRDIAPKKRLEIMVNSLNKFYNRGKTACLIDLFGIGEAHDLFHESLQASEQAWEKAISQTLIDAGFDKDSAERRAEQALIQIQGALVIARAKRSPQVFIRTLNNLPDSLLAN